MTIRFFNHDEDDHETIEVESVQMTGAVLRDQDGTELAVFMGSSFCWARGHELYRDVAIGS